MSGYKHLTMVALQQCLKSLQDRKKELVAEKNFGGLQFNAISLAAVEKELAFRARPKFFHGGYGRTWSRVLAEPQDGIVIPPYSVGRTIEVDLVPLNWHPGSLADWQQVREVRIRAHCTPRHAGDTYHHVLPTDVHALIYNKVGPQAFDSLMNDDFLSMVDWVKYEKVAHFAGSLTLPHYRKES